MYFFNLPSLFSKSGPQTNKLGSIFQHRPKNEKPRNYKILLLEFLPEKKRYGHIFPLLRDLHWHTVRIDFKIHMLTYKCLNELKLAPSYLGELKLYEPSHPVRSRHQPNLKVPKTHLILYCDKTSLPCCTSDYGTTHPLR